jgi:hypothetical protein
LARTILSTGFETALKETHEFAGNNKYSIPFAFKEERTICRKRMFDYENDDERIANPENHFRIEYCNVMVNEMRSNFQTRFELFAECVDKFGFVLEVSDLKKMLKEELLKHCQNLKIVVSVGDDCNVDCHKLFEELQVLSSVIPSHISNIRDMFKFIVQQKLSEVCPNVFILLRIIMTVPVTTVPAERSFLSLKLIDIPPNNNRTGVIDGIGHSFNRE